MKPLVSIRIAAYNTENFIEDAIKCVFKDIYANKELIIVDDGSTDNTAKIIKKYESSPFVKAVYLDKNRGNPYALNVASELCSGEIIAKLDSDDICDFRRITLSVEALEKEDVDIVTCKAKFLLPDGSYLNHINLGRRMHPDNFMNLAKYANPVNASIVVWKHMFNKIGPLREDYKNGSDGVWNIKAILADAKWGFVNDYLYYYRYRTGQLHSDDLDYLITGKSIKTKTKSHSVKIRQRLKQGKSVEHLL